VRAGRSRRNGGPRLCAGASSCHALPREEAVMAYAIKEIFYTLQGEGGRAGRAAAFCRFAGCNLWSGREEDRAAAQCSFCDTEFVGTDGLGGGRFADAEQLADAIDAAWAGTSGRPYVVFTGGEPLLQLDDALIRAAHARGFEIAIESNGTLPAPVGIDWICVSPKAGAPLRQFSGQELKLVYPQEGLAPSDLVDLDFGWFWLQPMAGPQIRENMAAAVAYCLADPRWRLSLQMHKTLGIP
jgi:7-carboxy-7-deazaguanine synthase